MSPWGVAFRRATPFGISSVGKISVVVLLKRIYRPLLLLCLLFVIGRLPKPLVTLGPQQRVVTVNPKMGVHTRLTDEVEEWKIKHTLELVREMGAPWIVEYFPWAYYEPAKGRFDWAHADLVVDHAIRQGLTVIARLDFVPQWARPEESTASYLEEEHFGDFGDFVYDFAQHFKGRVDYIIIWNEPNLSSSWGFRPVDPEGYVRLLKGAYQRAKEANSEVKVLAAGLAPNVADLSDGWALSDLTFLQRMYDAGAKGYFDILAVHAYGEVFPPDDPPAEERINFARTELIHDLMARNGDDRPIIITEGGWNDHPRWTKAVRPYQRIAYTIRAYQKAQKEWPWCQAVVLWAFRTPWPQRNFRDYFTFVTPEFILKPIYSAVQGYAQGSGEWLE